MLGSRWCPSNRRSIGLNWIFTHRPTQVRRVDLQLWEPYMKASPGFGESPKNSLSQYVASEALIGLSVQEEDLSEKLGSM